MSLPDITGNIDSDSRAKDRLLYRLLLLQASKDDPIVGAEMLSELKKAYQDEKIRVPVPVQAYMNKVAKKLARKLKRLINEKKSDLRALKRAKKRIHNKKATETKKKASRTDAIFGRDEESTYEEALDYLNSIEMEGMNLGLSRMNSALSSMGNPHKNMRFIHITGTNGKGSVSAMLASILKDSRTVGLYTSPHLIDFRERIQVDGRKIPEESVVEIINYLKPFQKRFKLTYFELTTLMAILYFKEKKTGIAVMEVGLGGRLDATNVISPLVSIITNIDHEHTEHLGDTIDKIAEEKAGIIKKNIPVVTATTGEALTIIKNKAREKNAKVHLVLKAVRMGNKFSVGDNTGLELSLKGNFQMDNAAIALTAAKLIPGVTDEAIKKGLKYAKWPGRFDFVRNNLLLDCTHNPAGAKTLSKELSKLNFNNIIWVAGIMSDKNIKGIISALMPKVSHVIITEPSIDRASDPEIIANEVKKHTPDFETMYDVKEALHKARVLAQPDDLILVAGSCYLVGEIMGYLQ